MKPRILFISNNSFSDHSNNGKTFKSIFSDYKQEEIAQIYFTESSTPDFTFCNKYFLINDKDVLINILSMKRKTGKLFSTKSDYDRYPNIISGSKSWSINPSLMRLVRDFIWSFNSWKSNDLLYFINSFNPDCIFFVGGPSRFSHDVALFVKQYLNKPLVVYFTDDYLLYPKVNSIWERIQKIRMLRFYRNTLQASSICLTIGKKMSRVYSLFFKRRFETIMNSVPLLPFSEELYQKDKLIISYFGSLHTNRWKMIERIGSIISNAFTNQIALHVYTTETPGNDIVKRFQNAGILFKGAIFGEQLKTCMSYSDALLHVESDDHFSASKTRLSVSTKIPEYLMTGKPIVAFGPKYVASMELLTENKIGIFISSDYDDPTIENCLRPVLDHNVRKNIGMAGYNYAVSNFDNQRNILEMQSFLKDNL